MIRNRGTGWHSVIAGTSSLSQQIERLWRGVYRVASTFHSLFYHLEEFYNLDPISERLVCTTLRLSPTNQSMSWWHEHCKQNFVQPLVNEATTATHALGLNFTMKSWAESSELMSVIIHGPYLKLTQLLCVIWQYRLWAACPCLSWSAVAFNRSIVVELDRGPLCQLSLNSRAWNFSTCANLKCTCMLICIRLFN